MFRTQCVLAFVALYVGLAQSWEIAVTAGDRIEFYTNEIKTDTIRFDSQNLAALAYDEVHNMLLYVDKQRENDNICGYNISSKVYKCYIERSGRDVQGLAFDPITETLFFTDTKERSINWISINTETENNVNGHLLIKMADGIPTDIAVDSCRGYIYWINTNLTESTVERARFNGSEREVVINSSHNRNLHSLAIDQQTEKIYWLMPQTTLILVPTTHLYSADLRGRNKITLAKYILIDDIFNDNSFTHPNVLTISKNVLFMVKWCSSCSLKPVWKFPEPTLNTNYYKYVNVYPERHVGIAAKNNIREQIQGVQDCKVLTSLAPNNSFLVPNLLPLMTNNSHISVCENYCLQGNCTFNEEGLPKCRCNAGYSGERCEVNACHGHCLNNGTCSLNADSEPVCQCIRDYLGDRCEVSDCLNYCLQGDCSFNEEGVPECRCNAGYSGERCEVNACHGYCLNNSTCSLNEKNEPVCQCIDNYAGDRCHVPTVSV